MPLLYATTADLTAWTGLPVPDNADRLLRAASMLVRGATRTAVYSTTPAGLPRDEDVAEAFRDATCAQAEAWAQQDIDPDNPTAGPRVAQSKSIGSASVTYADAGQIVGSRADAARTLGPTALAILADAGLTNGRVWVTG